MRICHRRQAGSGDVDFHLLLPLMGKRVDDDVDALHWEREKIWLKGASEDLMSNCGQASIDAVMPHVIRRPLPPEWRKL